MKTIILAPILTALAAVPYAIGQIIGQFWAYSPFDGMIAMLVMSPLSVLTFTCWWAWYRLFTNCLNVQEVLPPPDSPTL